MIWILAPAGLAFALFAIYLIVSVIIKDPARPFRMFRAPPLEESPESRVQSPEEEKEEENSRFKTQDSKKE